jgi:hypothetical protein
VDADKDRQDRLAWISRVTASPPIVHPEAPNGAVWNTDPKCYQLMAEQLHQGARTLETGAGVSTVLFAAWGCDHLAVVPFQNEADAVVRYCDEHEISRDTLRFDVRPSELALPELAGTIDQLDLVFIDGCHGFPIPIIDWFYGAGLLRKGGVVIFDDIQLPQVSSFIDSFLGRDDRWQQLESTEKWAAFRRLSEGPLGENQVHQPFFPDSARTPLRRVKDAIPLNVRTSLWKILHGSAKSQ